MNQSQTSELQGQRKKLTGAQKREHEVVVVVRNGQRFMRNEGGLGYFVDKTLDRLEELNLSKHAAHYGGVRFRGLWCSRCGPSNQRAGGPDPGDNVSAAGANQTEASGNGYSDLCDSAGVLGGFIPLWQFLLFLYAHCQFHHTCLLLQVMTYNQPYQITLELEMPESPANQELGKFPVKMTPYSKAGQIVDVTARSAMLHYRSSLLQALGTVVFSPMLLTGASEQKQSVIVELYSEFKDDSYKPTVGAVIEIHSQHIQIYSAHLYIFAHFTGIRYLLYHFPLISALIGVMSNFAFLSLIIVLSFLQFNLISHRTPGKAVKLQEEKNEQDGLNDQSEPQDEEHKRR